MPRSEIDTWEGRLEFWDADTEIAWVAEPTTPYHEKPSRRLTALMDRIAAERGSAIACYGSMDLIQRDEHGAARRILQADESVYVHPRRARLPGPKAMMAGEDDFPDVVLEVDHTTDVRRAKLGLYEAWGFPEVWVEVPDQGAGRPRRRRPGLTIHRRVAGAFQASAASGAFPGWTAAEIHAALNETELSERTFAVLHRVGAALGARDGTGPDDDPMLGWHRRQSRAEGVAQGRRQPGWRWSARSCGGGASRSRTRASPSCRRSTRRRMTPSSARPWSATTRPTSWRGSGASADHLRWRRHRAPVRWQPGPRPPRIHARAAGFNPTGVLDFGPEHVPEHDMVGAPPTCRSIKMRP